MNTKHKMKGEELFEAIASLQTAKDAKIFFADLCTPGEITAMSQRLAAAKMLLNGATYEQVIAATDISSATLSRVSKCVKNGDGYRKVLLCNKE